MMTRGFAQVRAGLVLAVMLAGAGASAQTATPAAEPVLAPQPLTCLLVPARDSAIGSDRSGIVQSVEVRRADWVTEGQALIQIDRSIAEADLSVARITIAALEERLSRSEQLVARNLVSRDEIGSLRAELALARAQEARALIEVERATIRAPFAGYVAEVAVSAGELVGPDPMLRLIDVSRLRAEMVYLIEDFGTLAPGDDVALAIDLTGADVPARIIAIDPFLDAASNSFTVLAEIDNSDLTLPAGTTCRVTG